MKKLLFFCCLGLLLFNFSCGKKQVTLNISFNDMIEDISFTKSSKEFFEEPQNITIEHGQIVEYIYKSGEKVEFPIKIKENTTIYAKIAMEQYTYKFLNYDNSVIKEVTADYGSKIIYPDAPERPSNDSFDYKFTGWSHKDTILTSNITFKPRFERVQKTYTVTFIDANGNITTLDDVYAGDSLDMPTESGVIVPDGYYGKILGWKNTKTNEYFDFENDSVYSDLELKCDFDMAKLGNQALEGATVSIIGDSISTFYEKGAEAGSIYHGKNQYHYPIYSQTVKDVKQTWWYHTILNVNARLGINNSWAGTDNASFSASAGRNPSRLKTLDDFGNPDIVFIYMGTNDNGNGNNVESFKDSLIYQINYITENFTIKKEDGMYYIPVIYIFTLGYCDPIYNSTEERRLGYNNVIRELGNQYENVRVFDLAIYITKDNFKGYLGDRVHYNADGMNLITEKLTEQLKKDYNVLDSNISSTYSSVLYLNKKKRYI